MATATVREKIVDTALALAERRSWEAVRLHDVAAALEISLDDVRHHFKEKEDIVDAWFDRADAAMLKDAAAADFQALGARERLQRVIMTWLGALAAHRRPTRQMIYNKFEPGHIHYQLNGLFRVSRTVQWMREAAHRDATLPLRAFEEAALTSIYLATVFRWLHDDSAEFVATRALLDRLLRRAEQASRFVRDCRARGAPRPGARPAEPTAAQY